MNVTELAEKYLHNEPGFDTRIGTTGVAYMSNYDGILGQFEKCLLEIPTQDKFPIFYVLNTSIPEADGLHHLSFEIKSIWVDRDGEQVERPIKE